MRVTRSTTPTFLPSRQCVICGKEYWRGRKPQYKVTTKSRETVIKEKAQSLKFEGEKVLHRIEAIGYDLVANNVCYHKECMDRFCNKRQKKGKSEEHELYDHLF